MTTLVSAHTRAMWLDVQLQCGAGKAPLPRRHHNGADRVQRGARWVACWRFSNAWDVAKSSGVKRSFGKSFVRGCMLRL
jgi:hypothetical protein